MNNVPTDFTIANFRMGELNAFHEIFRCYYTNISHFVQRFVSDNEKATDIVLNCFADLWMLRKRFKSAADIKAFLFLTARNFSLDYLRTQYGPFQEPQLQSFRLGEEYFHIKADLVLRFLENNN